MQQIGVKLIANGAICAEPPVPHSPELVNNSLMFIAAILAFISAGSGSYWLTRTQRWRILDHPNQRSLHQFPVPRTGGWALLLGLFLSATLLALSIPGLKLRLVPIASGLLPLILISALDDWRGVAAYWRLLVHIIAAIALLLTTSSPFFSTATPLLNILFWIFSGLFIVWMINLYNFMDGMDGFAGGMALIGFSALAWLGRADIGFALLQLSIAAASAGFLLYNFPPAKIFLGDIGSTALGFLVAASSLWGSSVGLFPLWAALLIFSPFIVDASVTLLWRILRRERIWQAHRSHYYQRLVLCGWSHKRTVLTEYALMLVCALTAIFALQFSLSVIWIIAGCLVTYSALGFAVYLAEH